MKIRHGFVSNSSSSSFIVAFPHKPKSAAELQKMLFGNEEVYPSPFEDKQWTAQTVAEVVWRDLEKQKPSNLDGMQETARGGWIEGQPDFDDFRKSEVTGPLPGNETDWDAYSKACDEFARKYIKDFADKHPDAVVFSFVYSDNDGEMSSAMEHGTLFKRIPHSRISHH